MDDFGTYETATIRKWFVKGPRFRVHFTASYLSWLILLERCFATLTELHSRRCAHRSREPDVPLRCHARTVNQDPKPFAWAIRADEIPQSVT